MKKIAMLTFISLLLMACAEDLQPKKSPETKTKMEHPLKAELSILDEKKLFVKIILSNPKGYQEAFNQPMRYVPDEEWEYSEDAYQISVLQSFHILKITLMDKDSNELEQKGIRTLADHIFFNKSLEVDQTIEILIPLNEFYDLKKGDYLFTFEYGFEKILASGAINFQVN